MRGGFPSQQELQVLKALGSFGSLDLDHLAERIGRAANVYKVIMDLKGIGWIRQSSNAALGPTGRVRNRYQRTIFGDRVFAVFEELGAELTRRLLSKSGRGFWPVGPELQIMRVLQLHRTSKELDVTRLLAQLSGPQRLLKDAMRRAHKKGHIDLKGTENRLRRNFTTQRCCLTHQGSLALELHSQAVIAMTRAKRSRSLPVSIAFPTALQAALIQAIQLFPEGALIKEVRAALPSEVRMVTVPSALMRLCRRGWVSLEKSADGENGRYKLTNAGQGVWRAMMRSFSGHS